VCNTKWPLSERSRRVPDKKATGYTIPGYPGSRDQFLVKTEEKDPISVPKRTALRPKSSIRNRVTATAPLLSESGYGLH